MNVVVMTGRLTGEPARKETTKGVVTTFRICSDEPPRVWIAVECWGHLAGVCAAHLAARRHIAVGGALSHSEWTDGLGQRREHWFIKASKVTFLDGPDAGREIQG